MRKFIAFVAMLFLTGSVLAQTDPCIRRRVPVNVVNGRGRPVTGLTENNFTGSIHHQPVKIVSVTPDGTARRVVIVLDASGSMISDRYAWHLYVAAGRNLIAQMPEDTLAGLVLFSSKVEENIPLTATRTVLQNEFARLEAGTKALPKGQRQTAFWDALATAASDFGPSQDGDTIYAISDSGDNASKTDTNILRERLLAKGTRVFFFSVIFSDGPVTSEERAGPASLMDLIQATGGDAVEVSTSMLGVPRIILEGSGKLTPEGELLMSQFRQIFSFQRIEVELPKAPNKTQDWNLKIAGMKTKDLTLVYPHRLAGCAIQSQSASSLQ
jgi:hypothetical protein